MQPGMELLVHSSLSSFGSVEGGAGTVIEALLSSVGSDGTIVVPTLTGSEALGPENPPFFDPLRTPCWTGRIPETFRQRDDAVRSLHATHSAAAIGASAEELTGRHIDSVTPCDEHSPYGLLAGKPSAYILLIGVGHESNTTMHHIEELAGVQYHLQQELTASTIRTTDGDVTRHIVLHRYGTDRRFSVVEEVLEERGIQRSGCIGAARLRLIHTPRFVETVYRLVRADPYFLCA